MADDVVKRLRQHALMCDHGFLNGGGPMGPDPTECASCRRSQQAADLIEAQQDEIERLRAAVNTVTQAVWNAGSHPDHHREVMRRHTREWPVLWEAIHALVKEARRG